jgi:hypothetical protein
LLNHFDTSQTTAMTVAMKSAWRALAFVGADEIKLARLRELLAGAILTVASEGVSDPKTMSTMALRRLPPAVAKGVFDAKALT